MPEQRDEKLTPDSLNEMLGKALGKMVVDVAYDEETDTLSLVVQDFTEIRAYSYNGALAVEIHEHPKQ